MKTLWFQFSSELWKLFARQRTYLGFVAFVGLEIAVLVIIKLVGIENWWRRMITMQGESFDNYFSAYTVAFIIMGLSILLLGGLYLCLVSGDIVAKESEDGHMRLLLARPISRIRLLSIKYVACQVYTFVLIMFVAVTALILGFVVRGFGGGLFAYTIEHGVLGIYTPNEAPGRYFLFATMMALGMTTITSVGFFFSCFKIKPAAATIAALSYALIDSILFRSGLMQRYDYLLFNKHFDTWSRVLSEDIPWPILVRNYVVLFAMSLSFFAVGVAAFQSRDLKS
jgi:ABC-2 type transport system permease protein